MAYLMTSSIPSKMLAAILVEQHKPLEIAEVTLPGELNYGQVLVHIYYSGICGSQIGEIEGVKGKDPYLPHLLGHEGSGKVIKIGPAVKNVRPGDHVILHWRKGSGLESEPPTYKLNGKIINAGRVTTFNEYAVISENRLTPIPENLDLEAASLLGCAITTGFGVVNNNAQIKIGESVVIFGVGGVGLSEIQAAKMVSAFPIVAVDINDAKLEFAANMGATHLVNSLKINVKEECVKILGENGADKVIDNTGDADVISLAYELTQPKGRTILVGVPRKGNPISIYSLPLHFGKVITGSDGGETQPSDDIPRYVRLEQSGRLDLKKIITDRFNLKEINAAIEKMKTGKVLGRLIIKF